MNISLVASAIKTNLWNDFMKSLESNSIDYEVIFVGDVKPECDIPKLKWIYSKVKPAQCYQIGYNIAQGELISWTADDAIYSNRALDIIYDFHKKQNEDKLITGFTVYENNGSTLSKTSDGHRLSTYNSPQMICFG